MERFGYSIFCDDIRHEINGKLSLIGCYNGQMFVGPEYPVTIPKFCVLISVHCKKTNPIKDLRFEVFLPGDDAPAISTHLPVADAVVFPNPPDVPELPENEQRLMLQAEMGFVPLQISKSGRIRVVAIADGEEIKLGGLTVSLAQHLSQRPAQPG